MPCAQHWLIAAPFSFDVICHLADPTGTFAATTSFDTTVKLWDPKTGTLTSEIRVGAVGMSVGFGGEHLLVGCSDNKSRVWSVVTKRSRHTLVGHNGTIQ